MLADFVLPLACVDDIETTELPKPDETNNGPSIPKSPKASMPGVVRTLAPEGSPLLPNLGKATAHAYWLDLTVSLSYQYYPRRYGLTDPLLDEGNVQFSRENIA